VIDCYRVLATERTATLETAENTLASVVEDEGLPVRSAAAG